MIQDNLYPNFTSQEEPEAPEQGGTEETPEAPEAPETPESPEATEETPSEGVSSSPPFCGSSSSSRRWPSEFVALLCRPSPFSAFTEK